MTWAGDYVTVDAAEVRPSQFNHYFVLKVHNKIKCNNVHCAQGSYRKPKVLNILEFYFFIRVPLIVLEFVPNVLECA